MTFGHEAFRKNIQLFNSQFESFLKNNPVGVPPCRKYEGLPSSPRVVTYTPLKRKSLSEKMGGVGSV